MFVVENLKRIIGGLYHRLAEEQEVEDAQMENLNFMRAADSLVDVDRLTGESAARDMQRTEEQLETTQWIIEDLNDQLDEAISQWSSLSGSEGERREEEMGSLPWPGFPGPPQVVSERTTSSSSSSFYTAESSWGSGWQRNGVRGTLDDPGVGAFARYHHQYAQQCSAGSVKPEQLLETETNGRSTSSESTGRTSFAETLRGSYQHHNQHHHHHHQQQERPAPAETQSSVRYPLGVGSTGTFSECLRALYQQQHQQESRITSDETQSVRSSLDSSDSLRLTGSVDFWLTPDYDPFFWEKHLGGRDIWAEKKVGNNSRAQVSGQGQYHERPVSPKTVVPGSWNPHERVGWI